MSRSPFCEFSMTRSVCGCAVAEAVIKPWLKLTSAGVEERNQVKADYHMSTGVTCQAFGRSPMFSAPGTQDLYLSWPQLVDAANTKKMLLAQVKVFRSNLYNIRLHAAASHPCLISPNSMQMALQSFSRAISCHHRHPYPSLSVGQSPLFHYPSNVTKLVVRKIPGIPMIIIN